MFRKSLYIMFILNIDLVPQFDYVNWCNFVLYGITILLLQKLYFEMRSVGKHACIFLFYRCDNLSVTFRDAFPWYSITFTTRIYAFTLPIS